MDPRPRTSAWGGVRAVPLQCAGSAEVFPSGIEEKGTLLVCTGFGESIFPRDFTARGRNTRRKQIFPLEWVGMGNKIRISTGTIWVGTGIQYFFGAGWAGTILHGNGNRFEFR